MNTTILTELDHTEYREHQITKALYDNAHDAFAGSFFSVLLVGFVLWDVYQGIPLWTSCGVILNIVRWRNCKNYFKNPDRFSAHKWLNIYRLLTFFSGCLYGAFAIFFFEPNQPVYQALVIFLVGGMGAAAVGTYSVDIRTYYLFLFSSVPPLAIRSFIEQTEVYVALSLMLSAMILVMLRAVKENHKIMIDNFDMTHSLHYRATHDGLVGLLNREEFKNIYENELNAPSQRENESTVAMIFIDLDNFKHLNDTFGHKAGDDALIRIGDIIRGTIRQDDIAARFGGDEFMILIRSDSVSAAETVASKITDKISLFQQELAETESKLGASIGIGFSENKHIEFDALLSAADQACYQAKKSGKGKICLKEA